MILKNPYLKSNLIGIALNLLLVLIPLILFQFEYKSFVSVLIWSIIGYSVKTWILTLPLIGITKNTNSLEFKYKIIRAFNPFFFMVLWFSLILILNIQSLFFDFSFGYTQRFPHGLVQLLTMFFVCVLNAISLNNIRKKELNWRKLS